MGKQDSGKRWEILQILYKPDLSLVSVGVCVSLAQVTSSLGGNPMIVGFDKPSLGLCLGLALSNRKEKQTQHYLHVFESWAPKIDNGHDGLRASILITATYQNTRPSSCLCFRKRKIGTCGSQQFPIDIKHNHELAWEFCLCAQNFCTCSVRG